MFTLPSNVIWPNGSVPALNSAANRIDALQFSTDDGVNYIGAVLTSSAVGSSLTINSPSGTIYPGSSIAVSDAYTGLAPANLGVSLDSAAYANLTAGSATITNGTFSFAQTAPSTAGTHTIQVNSTSNTGEASNQLSYAVAAAAPPTSVSTTGTAGNAAVAVTAIGTANGAPVTSFTEQDATSSSGPFTTVATLTPSTSPISGSTSASGTVSGLTNGTALYFQTIANTTAGNVTSAVAGPYTPTATVASAPTHYLASDSSHNSYITTAASAPVVSDGYVDVVVWANLASNTAFEELASKWTSSTGSATAANANWIFQQNSSGSLFFEAVNSAGSFPNATSSVTALSVQTPSSATGEYYRVEANLGTAAVTPAAGAVTTVPAGYVYFSESPDGVNWTLVGTAITGLSTGGISATTTSSTAIGTLNSNNIGTGSYYKLIERNSAGTLLVNADYTSLATGATTFNDTAATPNAFTISASGEK